MKNNQFAVIGMGRFGRALAKELYATGKEVLAVDSDENNLEMVSGQVTHAIQANIADEASFAALGLHNFDVVIVAISENLKASIMACLFAKEEKVPFVVAKAYDAVHAKILKKIGVDKIVFPEQDIAIRLAHTLVSATTLDFIEISKDFSMSSIKIPAIWAGKSISALNIRAKFGVNITAVRSGEQLFISPEANRVFAKDEIVIVIASNSDLIRFENQLDKL